MSFCFSKITIFKCCNWVLQTSTYQNTIIPNVNNTNTFPFSLFFILCTFKHFENSNLWKLNSFKFQLFGPKLLLGRTSFSANLLLGSYCRTPFSWTKTMQLKRRKSRKRKAKLKAAVDHGSARQTAGSHRRPQMPVTSCGFRGLM